MSVDDEKLMAFADGELSPAERAEIERELAADEKLREKLAAHQRLRARLSAAFDGALEEPVPAALLAAAQSAPRAAEVIDLTQRRPVRWATREWGAMAASLAAGVLIGLGAMQMRAPLIAASGHGLVARGALAQALDTQLAADAAGEVRIGLSFRAHGGVYCRTFDLTQVGAAGIACRDAKGWAIARAVAQAPAGELRMAGAVEENLNAVDKMIVGEPLDAAGEARARAMGWR